MEQRSESLCQAVILKTEDNVLLFFACLLYFIMDLLINVSMSGGQAKHEGLFVAFLFVWGREQHRHSVQLSKLNRAKLCNIIMHPRKISHSKEMCIQCGIHKMEQKWIADSF